MMRRVVKNVFRAMGFEIRRIVSEEPPQNINTREYWNSIWSKESLESRNYAALHAAFCRIVPPNSSVLDVGCGNGRLLRRLMVELDCRATGLDLSETFLASLATLGVATVQASLPAIPFRSGSFDVTVSSETMEHLDHPVATVHEMHRVTRIGGLLMFSVPDGAIWGVGGEHVQCFTAAECHEAMRPYVKEMHLLTLSDHGFPHLLCWGETVDTPIQYHPDWYSETNARIAKTIADTELGIRHRVTPVRAH